MQLQFNNGLTTELSNEHVLGNDIIFPGEYNPHSVKLWVIGNEFGSVCAVWSSCEQDAFDIMVNENLGDSFLVDEEEPDTEYCYLGEAGEAADLTNAWIEPIDIQKQTMAVIIRLAECRGGAYDTMDF